MSRTILNRAAVRCTAIGVMAAGLAACAVTPTYPTGSEPATARPRAPPPVTPKTVASKAVAAPPPAALAAPGPAPVQTTTLSDLPPAEPATQTPAPYTPPPETSPTAEPPPLAVAPPPPTYRTEPARYAADGKVIHPHGMYRDYEVQRHDHLDAIARGLQVSPEDLIHANHLKDADHLSPGQHLRVPVEKAYVARSGNSLSEIARRFSVSEDELASLNDLSRRARLSSGEEIALPASFHDRGPVEVSAAHKVELYARREESSSAEATPAGGVYTPSPYALAAARAARERASGGASTYAYAPPPVMSPPPTESPGPDQAAINSMARGRFIWPLQGTVLSKFGAMGVGERNDGLDIAAPEGTVVRAAAAGNVVYAGNQIPGFGNLVLLQHTDGWVTAYAHLERVSVEMRQNVSQGEEIGQVGETGGVSQPQLHFEIRYKRSAGDKAKPIDPLLALPANAGGSER